MISIFQFRDMELGGFISQNESITDCESISDSGVTFFMTFVLPMVMDDIGTLKGFIIFSFIMLMLCTLMWKTNLFYQNPVLTILGYEIIAFRFEDTEDSNLQGKNCVGITRKTEIENGMRIKRQYIANNVFLIYKE